MVPSLRPEAGAGVLAAEDEASSGEADVVGRAAAAHVGRTSWGGGRREGSARGRSHA